MEVAAGQHFAAVGENQWIVGNCIGLDQQSRGCLAEQVEAGAHHLRLAAQAVGILDAGVLIAVRLADGAAGQQIPIRSEEHTYELQSIKRISYAVFCLKKKTINKQNTLSS